MFAGVGERTREGNDLYYEMIEGGVIKVHHFVHLANQFYMICYVFTREI